MNVTNLQAAISNEILLAAIKKNAMKYSFILFFFLYKWVRGFGMSTLVLTTKSNVEDLFILLNMQC